MSDIPDIRNRITEVRKMRLGDVAQCPFNWKDHPESQGNAFDGIVREIGWMGVPLAYHSEKVGGLAWADGNMRGKRLPDHVADVALTDLVDEEVKYALLTYDPIAAMAEANREILGSLLQSVQSDEAAVQALLSELAQREGVVFGGDGQVPEDPGPQVDRASELQEKWQIETGDLWVIPSKTADGEHRIICGDCTDGAVVGRVMGGEKIDIVLADPPYNIGKAEWDDIADFDTWFINWAFGLSTLISDNCSTYIFGWPETLASLFRDFPASNKRLLVWYYDNKNAPNQKSWGRSFELIIYAWQGKPVFNKDNGRIAYKQSSIDRAKYGLSSKFGGGKSESEYELHPLGAQPRDVLFYPTLAGGRGQVERVDHPTQKPLDLISVLIAVSSNGSQIIYDAFLGSGTTMVAAERLGRLCRGIEIDPAYCAVALERLKGLGLDPQRID